MKTTILSLFLCCIACQFVLTGEAQSSMYNQLNPEMMPSNRLRDKAPHHADWEGFSGGLSDTLSSFSAFKQLYFEIEKAEFQNELPDLSELWEQVGAWQSFHNSTPLIILDFNFAQLLPEAQENGWIGFDNGHFFDVPTEVSPYIQKHIFIAFPGAEFATENNTTLYIGPEFYFSDSETLPVELNLLINNQPYEVQLGSTLELNIQSDLVVQVSTDNGGSFQVSNFSWKSAGCNSPMDPDPAPWPAEDENFPWLIQAFHNNELVEANAYVKYRYGQENQELDKVFVFVEGIDFNNSHTLSDLRFGDFGWCQFTAGNAEDYEFLYNSPALIEHLRNEGFDIILLDFKKGATYIQENAAVLKELLQRINAYKIGKEPIVLAGASMGGQVTRYALSSMDNDGEEHCVSLWISLDSPHKGANIPLGFQEMLQDLADNPNPQYAEVEEQLANTLNRPAARQMLIHQRPGYSLFDSYYSELESLGFPREVMSYGIANGSGEAIELGIENDYLFDFHVNDPIFNENLTWMKCLSSPGDANGLISTVHLPSEYLIVGDQPCSAVPISYSGGDTFYPFPNDIDECPGSKRSTIEDFAHDFIESAIQNPCIELQPDFVPHHTFIPSSSALAVQSPTLFEHLNYELVSGGLSTPFDLYLTGDSINQEHSRISEKALLDIIRFTDRSQHLEEELTAAHPNNGIYNMSLLYNTLLYDLTIHNGGELYLNAGMEPEYGMAEFPIPEEHFASHMVFRTNQCDAYVEVGNEGYLQIGDALFDKTADLHIRSGSVLHIEDGGELKVSEGSQLIIRAGGQLDLKGILKLEDNAKLVIEQGATMNYQAGAKLVLAGGESVMELSGQLHLGEDAEFSVLHPNAPSGKIQVWSNDVWITGDSGSKIILQGDYPQDKLIEVMPNASFMVESSVTSVELHSSRIQLHEYALFNCATNFTAMDVNFDGEDESVITVWKSALFRDCGLMNVDLLAFQAEEVLRIERCFLEGSEVQVEGMGYRIYDSHFESSFIESNQLAVNSRIVDCVFNGNNSLQTGILENSNISLFVKNSNISSFNSGIVKQNGELKLKCNELHDCASAVSVESYASLILSTILGGGNNSFDDNVIHVHLDHASGLSVSKGFNDFSGNSDWVFYGSLLGNCDENCESVMSATSNVWNTFGLNSPAAASIELILIDSDCDYTAPMSPESGCEIIVQDKLPISTIDCSMSWHTSGGTTKPGSAGSSSLENEVQESENDPLLQTTHYDNILLSKAVADAVSLLTAHQEEDGNDFDAILRLHEILNSGLDRENASVRQLSTNGLMAMRIGLEDLLLRGEISLSTTEIFGPVLSRYVDILNAFTEPVVPKDCYSDQFKLEIQKPYVYGLFHKWEIGKELLADADDCGLDSLEQELLNREMEKMVFQNYLLDLNSLLCHPDSTWSYESTLETESPQNLDLEEYGFGAWLASPENYQVGPCPIWQVQSFEQLSRDLTLSCYPIPAVGSLTVECSNPKSLLREIHLLDNQGRQVLKQVTNAERVELNITGIASGNYLLTVQDIDGSKQVKMVVVAHDNY